MYMIAVVMFSRTVLNANMRRIDLLCKLLAPIVAGVLLTHTGSFLPSLPSALAGGFAATVIIGLWNVVSFFGELSLLVVVYRLVPALAIKKLRGKDDREKRDEEFEEEEEEEVAKVKATDRCLKALKKIASPYRTIVTGWSIFWKQETNLVGFSLASLYLTVLGFSGVTATYLLTQGLTSDFIGLAQGIGGIFGIAGTLVYPFLQRKVGTVRTGLFGISAQVAMLMFCVAGVFSPGKPTHDFSTGYYSPNCSSSHNSISPTPALPFTSLIDPSPSVSMYIEMSPSPSVAPTDDGSGGLSFNLSVFLLLVGVTGARFGLWMFDLSVSQLIQEKVVVQERGVVSGVMNAMNSNMDMLHYVMVIVAPRPQEFPYLTIISFCSVFMGWIFYCCYVRRARGHFFHLDKISKCCGRGRVGRVTTISLSVINRSLEDKDETEDDGVDLWSS